MATTQGVQKKIDTKVRTLELLEKDTPRSYERNKESELIIQKKLRETFRRNQRYKDGNSRGDDRKRKHQRRN